MIPGEVIPINATTQFAVGKALHGLISNSADLDKIDPLLLNPDFQINELLEICKNFVNDTSEYPDSTTEEEIEAICKILTKLSELLHKKINSQSNFEAAEWYENIKYTIEFRREINPNDQFASFLEEIINNRE